MVATDKDPMGPHGTHGIFGIFGVLGVFIGILIFCGGFGRLEWSHDVPRPSGIISGPRNTQNDGMRIYSDQFLSFLDHFGKVESPNPQLLFQSQPHTASQAKPLCGK